MAFSWYTGPYGPDGAKNVEATKDQIIARLTAKVKQLLEEVDELECRVVELTPDNPRINPTHPPSMRI